MIMKLCQLLNFRTSVSTDLSSFSAKVLASETQPGDRSPGCVSEASTLAHLKLKKSDGTQLDSNHFICAVTSLSAPL